MGHQAHPHETADVGLLTPREKQICSFLALGFTNREIAQKLSISERTVETHRANLINKLGLKSRAELVQFAIGNNLLKTD
jgi:two-component system response regulator NreC